jgi:hypothetical protein
MIVKLTLPAAYFVLFSFSLIPSHVTTGQNSTSRGGLALILIVQLGVTGSVITNKFHEGPGRKLSWPVLM